METWDDFEPPRGQRSPEELKRIIRYQRWLIAVVLAQLVLWGAFVALSILGSKRLTGLNFPLFLTILLGVVGGIFVFLISWELRGAFAAFVFGAATVVPCLGLVVLTLVNGYATNELKKHGLKVGMFGGNSAAIEERTSPYEDEDAGW